MSEYKCLFCDKPATHYEYWIPNHYTDSGYGIECYYCAECVEKHNITTADLIDTD